MTSELLIDFSDVDECPPRVMPRKSSAIKNLLNHQKNSETIPDNISRCSSVSTLSNYSSKRNNNDRKISSTANNGTVNQRKSKKTSVASVFHQNSHSKSPDYAIPQLANINITTEKDCLLRNGSSTLHCSLSKEQDDIIFLACGLCNRQVI